MSTLSSTRSRTVMACVVVAALPLVSACAAGKSAPVRQEYEVSQGVQAHAGNVALRNLLLTADVPMGTAAKSLSLQGAIANDTGAHDALVGVVAGNTPFNSKSASVAVDPGNLVNLGTSGLGLTVSLPTGALPGTLVSLTFSFQQSGHVTVAVPVYSQSSQGAGAEPTNKVTYPTPELPGGYNEKDADNQPAA